MLRKQAPGHQSDQGLGTESIEDSALRLITPVDSVETGLRRWWSAHQPILFSYLQRRETITSFTSISVHSITSQDKFFLYTLYIIATQRRPGDKGPFYLRRLSRRVDQSDVNTIHFPPLPQPPRRDPPQNLVFTPLNSSNLWDTDTPSPPLLHVNRESRYEALAVYAPYFATPSNPRPIYLSLPQDVVRFTDGLLPYIPDGPLNEIQHMITDTKDCAYFGYYHMGTLKSMKRLRELEIYAEKGLVYGGDDADRFINLLVSEFEDAMEADPGWECPKVRIVDAQTGKDLRIDHVYDDEY
ncbi:hypothetical protein V501_04441 [Pseudogymnoascus sp. VKM F-4519 (FW-2642)]|nr:hypothetical protein V501_04441 [Pseudogymnoascus sp. VKM F-4519 (FW-2642)]